MPLCQRKLHKKPAIDPSLFVAFWDHCIEKVTSSDSQSETIGSMLQPSFRMAESRALLLPEASEYLSGRPDKYWFHSLIKCIQKRNSARFKVGVLCTSKMVGASNPKIAQCELTHDKHLLDKRTKPERIVTRPPYTLPSLFSNIQLLFPQYLSDNQMKLISGKWNTIWIHEIEFDMIPIFCDRRISSSLDAFNSGDSMMWWRVSRSKHRSSSTE
jgi:hypothetical protein